MHLHYAKLVPTYKLAKNTPTSDFQKHRGFFQVLFLMSVSPFIEGRGNQEAVLLVLEPYERRLQLTSCTILKKTPYYNPDLFPGCAGNWSTSSGIGRPLMNI